MYKQLIKSKTFSTAIALVLALLLVATPVTPIAYAEDVAPPPPAETPPPPPEPAPEPAPVPPPQDPAPSETPPAETPPEESLQSLNEETQDPAPLPETPPGEDGNPGEPGGDADTPEDTNDGTPGGPAEIHTGDAGAFTDSGVDANVNDTIAPTTASTTATSTNAAEVTQTTGASAGTGTNTAVGDGGAEITTGDAFASANIINVLNTNLVNSFGLFEFLNVLFGGGFDLRNLDLSYFFGNPTNGSCSLMGCADGNLTVGNTNNATSTNNLNVVAQTGDNTATSGGEGDAYIGTGDAYASGNLINVINTNFVNSNYLLIAANNFGDLFGDITLPNADFFAQLLAARTGGVSGDTTVTNNNNASVTNSIDAGAYTGGNTAETGDGSTFIETGNAVSSATSYNQVNTNMTGGSTFYMLINVLGDWSGEVTGLPDGITWMRTPTGIALMADEGAAMPTPGCCDTGSLNVQNTNNASVTNNVEVYALTGNNYASADSGVAGIETGNAYASANVVNIVNTNVVGQNWMFMIFNIFGNWNGNLSFGKPDLVLLGLAETPNPTNPGSEITYRFTVANMGDTDATNAKITADYNRGMLAFSKGQEGVLKGAVWNLGTIKRGETKEFTYTAKAGTPSGEQLMPVPLVATVTSTESDNNMEDNTERLSVVISTLPPVLPGSYGFETGFTHDPRITVTKTASVSTTTVPATVDYTVVLRNNGGELYNGVLNDKLIGPDGETVYERAWDIYTMKAGEEITLTYSIVFNAGTLPGLYKNTATISGLKNYEDVAYAQGMKPVSATKVIELKKGEGKVLGAALSRPACAEYITAFITPGGKNDPEQVKRLEYFLRDYEGETGIKPDGIYDFKTKAAVERFQEKYEEHVLGPWGIQQPTGVVYHTTKKAINEVRCANIARTQFPLSEIQQKEILAFRNTVLGSHFAKQAEPKTTATPKIDLAAPSLTVSDTDDSEEAVTPPPRMERNNRIIERTPALNDLKNPFDSFFSIFKWSQALLTVPIAEARVR